MSFVSVIILGISIFKHKGICIWKCFYQIVINNYIKLFKDESILSCKLRNRSCRTISVFKITNFPTIYQITGPTGVDAIIPWSIEVQRIRRSYSCDETYFNEILWCVSLSWIEYSLYNTLCLITDIVNASRVILYRQHICVLFAICHCNCNMSDTLSGYRNQNLYFALRVTNPITVTCTEISC